LTDIFGIFPNAQLLADEFAKSGYLTVIPDLFAGDQISVADMESSKADLPSWLPKHQPANVDPIIEASIKYVRETLGVKSVGAVGYCFGAKVCYHDAWDTDINGYENGFLIVLFLVRHPLPEDQQGRRWFRCPPLLHHPRGTRRYSGSLLHRCCRYVSFTSAQSSFNHTYGAITNIL
jgi:hypothetical protein